MHRLALSIFLPIFQSINPYSIGKVYFCIPIFIGKVCFLLAYFIGKVYFCISIFIGKVCFNVFKVLKTK